MSDFLMAFYDDERNAVIIQLQSGTEVAVMDTDKADSFADEVKAASRKESTGYEEFFAQQNGEGDAADLLEYLRPDGEPLDADSNPFTQEFHPDEQVCPRCRNQRPFAIASGKFLPATTCPHCGDLAGEVEAEQGNYLITLGDDATIRLTDEHGNSVDAFRFNGALPAEAQDWDHYAAFLGVTRSDVRNTIDALDATDLGYGNDEPDAQTLADAENALRLLAQDDAVNTEGSAGPGHQGPCILTGEPGENEDDCTTHEHEPNN